MRDSHQIKTLLEPIFEKHIGILFAYLFGSYTEGVETTLSDIDLAIFVENPDSFSLTNKLSVHADCCRALKRNDLDLVVVNQTRNLILLEQIIRTGIIIWNTNSPRFDDFELKTLYLAQDFKYQRHREMSV
jgi:uncharacterized protein